MNIDQKIKSERKEDERNDLINQVVNTVMSYKDLLEKGYKNFNTNNFFQNDFATQFTANSINNANVDENERLEVLAFELNQITDYPARIDELKNMKDELSKKQDKVIKAIDDLDHFYSVTKAKRKEFKKLKKIRKSIKRFKIENLRPLGKLEGAERKVKEFNQFKHISTVEKYITKDSNGKLCFDSNGYYQIDNWFFFQAAVDFRKNVRIFYQKNKDSLNKKIKNHYTTDRLRRYLTY